MTIFTKKGNTVGFTKNGEPVHGHYKNATKTWRVLCGEHPSLSDPRNQSFATERDAAAYASTLVDEQKTTELRWW